MGDATSGPVRLSFNPQLRVEFRGATVTSDAGLLFPRELDERLGLSALIERHLSDPRTGYNRQFPLPDLFRQSIYSRLAGYEDTNDAERLAEDPTFRMLASRERRETSVALTSTLHWFETEVLAEERNYQGLARLNTELVQREATGTRRVTLDIDSSVSPVHGAQEQSAYNGHFESVCYHPLFVLNQDGDCVAATLRPGNVHSADGWDKMLLPSLTGTRPGDRPSSSAPTRPLLSRPSMKRWSDGVWRMPSASRPTMSWSGPSRTFSPGHAADRATPRWCATGAFSIGPRPGTGLGG
jgi:hypothetical protein